MVYYNEFDPAAAAWLRELMAAGLIPEGVVDERSIKDVQPADVAGFSQCHFFAGIGGWTLALALAGWSGPVWTGSCPCQPFSSAGKRKGKDDPRHLWPDFHRLIRECRPPVVFGEQVARKDGLHWLAGVRTDLEAAGYAVGAADLAAAGVGAPHIRQRLFWVADAGCLGGPAGTRLRRGLEAAERDEPREQPEHDRGDRRLGLAEGEGPQVPEPEVLQGPGRRGEGRGPQPASHARFWDAHDVIPCSDGRQRRTQPGVHPLADGLPAHLERVRAACRPGKPAPKGFPGRVPLIRGYGNAIVPGLGAEFVAAHMEATGRLVVEWQ